MTAQNDGCEETNVFDKSNADKLACMLRRENDGCKETNVFDKPNDQSQACMSFGVARKRGSEETNVFDKSNADKLACMLRRENDGCKETNDFCKPLK